MAKSHLLLLVLTGFLIASSYQVSMTATLVNDLSGNNFSGWKSLRTWSPQPLTTTSCSGGTCLKIENKKDSVESSGFKNYQISGSYSDIEVSFDLQYIGATSWFFQSYFQISINGQIGFQGYSAPTNPYTVKFSMPFFCKVSELDVQIWGSNFGIRNLVIKGGNRCSGSCTCCLPEKLGSGCQDSATPLFTDLISSFNGWSDRRGNKVNTYTCQGNTILGPMGKDIGAHGTHFSKQYKLSRDVTGIAVSFEFNRVDSWDGESFYFYVNGKTVIQRAVQHQLELHGNTCTSGWNDEPIRLSFIIDLGTNVQDLLFSVSATLDQNAVDESYGLRDIKVYGWNECPSGAAKCIVEDHLLVTVECKPGASGCVEDTPDVKDLVTSFSGWTNTLTGSSMHTTTCTTGETILNGVGTTHDVHATKTFTLSKPHQYFVVYYKFYAVDSWDQEYFLALINNQYFSAVSTYWDMTTGNTCGNSYWPDKVFDIYEEVDLPQSTSQLEIEFQSTLDQHSVDESWGVRDLYIWGSLCNNRYCKTCSSSTQCTECKWFAYEYPDGSCQANCPSPDYRSYQSGNTLKCGPAWCDNRGQYYNQNAHKCSDCSPANTFTLGQSNDCNQKCSNPNEYFNKDSQSCQDCPNFKIFSESANGCVSCNNGLKNYYFNLAQNQCTKCSKSNQYNNGFAQNCLSCNTWQIFDEGLNNCRDCGKNNQYFSTSLDACTSCPAYQIYSRSDSNCIWCQTSNQYYDSTYDRCISCGSPTQYFDTVTTSCKECGTKNQFFNPTPNKCDSCLEFYIYDASQKSCVQCPIRNQRYLLNNDDCVPCEQTNQIFDYGTRKCTNCPYINQFFSVDNNGCTDCGKGNQIYSTDQNKCILCGTKNMYYSRAHDSCIKCDLPNQYYDSDKGMCVSCPYRNQFFNETLDMCVECEMKNTFFDPQQNACVECSYNNEIFDQAIDDCRSCDETNQIFNRTLNQCANCTFGNQYYERSPADGCVTCPLTDQFYDIISNTCVECTYQNEYFSTQFNRCYPCDYLTDYYDEPLGECVECGGGNMFFNNSIHNNSCVSCPQLNEFYVEGAGCIECPIGNMFFDKLKDECEFCNTTKSFFNNDTRSCEYCHSHKDYYDITLKECTSCQGNNTYYNEEQEECTNCPFGNQYFDFGANGCMNCTGTNQKWDESQVKCVSCGYNKDLDVHFNAKTGQCETCANSHEYYDVFTSECKECPTKNMFFDGDQRECQECPYHNQHFDPSLNACVNCPNSNEYFSYNTNGCEQCAGNEFFDNNTAPGQCMACKYKNQYYDATTNQCVFCSDITTYYNPTQSQCVSCPANSYFNKEENECVCYANARKNYQSGICESCAMGEIYFPNSETGTCQPCSEVFQSNSYFDYGSNACQACESNAVFDQNSGKCVACAINQYYSVNIDGCTDCQLNSFFNSSKGTCQSCGDAHFLNFTSAKCEACDEGCDQCQTSSGNCTVCSTGYFGIEGQNKCVSECPEHLFLDTDTQTCVEICDTGLYGNQTTGKCEACDDKCKSCFGGTSESCYSCSFGSIFAGQSSCINFGEPQRWEENGEDNSWTIPKDGDIVYVPRDLVVMISQDTAAVDTLIVDGTLYVNPDANGSITLNAQRIFVREGNFHCNVSHGEQLSFNVVLSSSKVPYTQNDTLNLTGDPKLNFVDKSFIVLGQVNFAGHTKSPLVRLAQPVQPGHQTIFIDGSVEGWEIGDQIILASTSFDASEQEIVSITDINEDEIQISKAASYYHYGAESALETSVGDLDNRGEVLMMSGTVSIKNDINTPENCQVYVAQDVLNGTKTVGRINFEDIVIDGCGKPGLGNGSIAVTNVLNSNSQASTVRTSRILNSGSAGIVLNNTQNFIVEGNLFYKNTNNSIVVTNLATVQPSKAIKILSNIIIETQIPKNLNSPNSALNIMASSVLVQNLQRFILQEENLLISDNIVIGDQNISYISPAENCVGSHINSVRFVNNTAHSGNYGWVILGSGHGCTNIVGFSAYLMQEGLVTSAPLTSISPITGASITASNLVMTDNKNSITLNAGFPGNQTKIVLQDSYIGGLNMDEVYTNSNSNQCNDLTGIRLSVIDQQGTTLPLNKTSSPIYKPTSAAIFNQQVAIQNVTFENWRNADQVSCSNMSVFKPNYYQAGNTAYHSLEDCSWNQVAGENVFQAFGPTLNISNSNKTIYDYSGRYNYIIHDLSGNMPNGPIITPNNEFLTEWEQSECTAESQWVGYSCSEGLGMLLIQHNSPTEKVIISQDGKFNNILTRNLISNSSVYSSLVRDGLTYNISFNGVPPTDFKLQTQGLNANSSITVTYWIDLTKLNNTYVQLKLNGSIINPLPQITGNAPIVLGEAPYNKCGDYAIDQTTGIASILVTNEPSCAVEAHIAYSVRMRSKLETDFTEFMQDHSIDELRQFIAIQVGVNANQVVINSLIEGSVIADFYIIADPSESAQQQQADLNNVITNTQAKAKSGQMKFRLDGSTVIPMNIEVDGDIFVGPDGQPVHDKNSAEHSFTVLKLALYGAGSIFVYIVCLKVFGFKSHKQMKDEDDQSSQTGKKEAAKEEIEMSDISNVKVQK